MKQNYLFRFYTIFWIIALSSLFYLLWNLDGNAHTINYTGIVRGSTQKLIKEELNGIQDDELITYIDEIIYDLQTGEGDYHIECTDDEEFQSDLEDLNLLWGQLKEEIYTYRIEGSSSQSLFELSQEHYAMADDLVHLLEDHSNTETGIFIVLFCLCTIICIATFIYIHEHNQKILNLSLTTNHLTHLRNQIGFEQDVQHLLRLHPNVHYTAISFDINNFKLINTTYDYHLGDELLCAISSALEIWREQYYVCAHLGSDNFIILAEDSEDFIYDLNETLKKSIRTYDVSSLFTEITFAYGIYRIPNNAESLQSIITKVSLAHKACKGNPLCTFSHYSQELLQKLEQDNYYTEHLEPAISNHEFKMYLQPQINLATLETTSAESLVRWQQPNGSMVYPDSFIPLFEKNGLISKIDFYILEQVCDFLDKHQKDGHPFLEISVNISRVTLSHNDFLDKFIAIVDQYQIPHAYIAIEVTESSLIKLRDSTIQVLHQLRELGFIISMDDFGAGYSSLNALSTLPVHVLKLDRQFLWGIDTNSKMSLVITSTVKLAHSMGLTVICEGVEQQSHVDFLQSIGCDYAQGYYFARPMPKEKFLEMIS